MIKRIFALLLFLTTLIIARPITFQMVVFDSETQSPLATDGVIELTTSFISEADANEYLKTTSRQKIQDGIINVRFTVDLTAINDVFVFDQPGLRLKVEMLNDVLYLPLSANNLAVLSKITDRTVQLADNDLIYIDYENRSVQIGGQTVSSSNLLVNGTLKADYFIGNGKMIYNAKGAGLNDDHSLEANLSRNCAPNNTSFDCRYGKDHIFVSDHPYVGLNTNDPKMAFDSVGRVLFVNGEADAGAISFPIAKRQSIFAWDHLSGGLKAGYVSRNASVSMSGFSDASVSIGEDIVVTGRNSSVFGGKHHTLLGQYSSVFGGVSHHVEGNYSVLIGGESDQIFRSYVANINGRNNEVSSNYTVLLSSASNLLNGKYQTVVGDDNLVSGQDNFVFGNQNQVQANHNIILGDATHVSHSNSFVINQSADVLVETGDAYQTIWMVDNGVAINTADHSESLVVSGSIMADFFRGDGSKLTNVSLVDKFWLLEDDVMTIMDYTLGLNTVLKRQNILNLKSGLILSSDGSSAPGTIAYENNDLVGYGQVATQSLLVQDTDTIYEVADQLVKVDNALTFATVNVAVEDMLVFDGNDWVHEKKNTWQEFASNIFHDRPISFWHSNRYLGRLTIQHPYKQDINLINESQSKGMSIISAGSGEKSNSVRFGFNILNEGNQRYSSTMDGYRMFFNTNSGVMNFDDHQAQSLISILPAGRIRFFGGVSLLDAAIPTRSQVQALHIDSTPTLSVLVRGTNLNSPMIRHDEDGELSFDAFGSNSINFRILPKTYDSLTDQNRIQIRSDGEVLLSNRTDSYIGQPMLHHPKGNMILDSNQMLGVFNTDKVLQSGMKINYDSITFYPKLLSGDTVKLTGEGISVRSSDQHALVVQDDLADSVIFVDTNNRGSAAELTFSREDLNQWVFEFTNAAEPNVELINSANQPVMNFSDNKIVIGDFSNPEKSLNIAGSMALIGTPLNLLPTVGKDDSVNAKPILTPTTNGVLIQPLVDASGIEFKQNDIVKLAINHDAVSIGSLPVPESPTKELYVNEAAHISDGLYYFDEKVEVKTIASSIDTFRHNVVNTDQELSFDFETGFDLISTQDATAMLTFGNFFSRVTGTTSDATDGAQLEVVKPNGIDVLRLLGNNISVSANNVASLGDPNGALDSLTFYNDLMNGGIINGNLLVSGNLRVIGIDPSDNDYYKFIGDISEMENIPFPWKHVFYDGEERVDYEYVITENVGIGMTNPEYDLDVAGVSSLNVVIVPSLNVTGFIQPKHDSFTMVAGKNINLEFELAQNASDERLDLNGLKFSETAVGLNEIDSDYLANFSPYALSNDSRMLITGDYVAELSFNSKADFKLNQYGDMLIGGDTDVKDIYISAGDHSISLSSEKKMGVNFDGIAKNSLDVSGSVVVGTSLAGKIVAPSNSLMVQSQMGIGTTQPKASMDVRGSMIVGNSTSYLGGISGLDNNLVIEKKMFVQVPQNLISQELNGEDVLIANGAYEGHGGLFFNKSASLSNSELSFYDDGSALVIGYGSGINNRSLTFLDDQSIYFLPKYNGTPMKLTESAQVGIGPPSPTAFVHIQHDDINLKIDSTATGVGDAQLIFQASDKTGVVGLAKEVPNQLVFSDSEPIIEGGADMAIDVNGNVDFGYKLGASSTPPAPSHNVRLDVNGKVNATEIRRNGNVLTHMPVGSIVMWSGYKAELPDGWRLCTGVDSEVDRTTSKCNFNNKFFIGYDSTAIKDSAGAFKYVGIKGFETTLDSADDGDKHTHTASHGHGNYNAVSHNHSIASIPSNNDTHYTTYNDAVTNTSGHLIGEQKYERWNDTSHCEGNNWVIGGCWNWHSEGYTSEHNNPTYDGAYSESGKGNHRHSVSINHGHGQTFSNQTHDHKLASVSHTHDTKNHEHTVDTQPEYYTLAFIYLEGEN